MTTNNMSHYLSNVAERFGVRGTIRVYIDAKQTPNKPACYSLDAVLAATNADDSAFYSACRALRAKADSTVTSKGLTTVWVTVTSEPELSRRKRKAEELAQIRRAARATVNLRIDTRASVLPAPADIESAE